MGILSPMAGYPTFVIIAGSIVTGNPVCTIGVRHVAGTETCGDYQRKNAQPDGAEDVRFRGVRFHDFKFSSKTVTD
jgi:hypothetical protein